MATLQPQAKPVHGIIMGGQQPVTGSLVSVYALGTGGSSSSLLATTVTDLNGNFQFEAYDCPTGPVVVDNKVSSTTKPAKDKTHPLPDKLGILSTKSAAFNTPSTTNSRPATMPDLTQSYLYITATGGNSGGGVNSSILLAAGLGKCSDAANETVEINEVSTAVFASAMQNYIYSATSSGSDVHTNSSMNEAVAALDVADTNTQQNIVNLSTGMVNPNVVATTPGETSITIDAAKIYSFANTIASCVNSADDLSNPTSPQPSSACQSLFSDVTPSDVAEPTTTLGAASYIAVYPYNNVSAIWALGSSTPPFSSGLAAAPYEWTIGVSYTTSSMGLGLFAAQDGSPTSSNIDIDSNGRVWFPSNKSGATGAGYFDPTAVSFNGPFGGSLLTQPQYVSLDDTYQAAVVTDLASANVVYVDTTPGGANGSELLFPATGFTSGPLLFNSDDSYNIVLSDTGGDHIDFLFQAAGGTPAEIGTFTNSPTGLTLNNLLGNDSDDPGNPVLVAATNGASTKCSLEFDAGSQGSLPGPFQPAKNPCTSGGTATSAIGTDSNSNSFQDQITMAATASDLCSQLAGGCGKLKVAPAGSTTAVNLMNKPVGVAYDGNNEVWVANAGNASIAVVRESTTTSGAFYEVSDRQYRHGTGHGKTMVSPAGIGIDSAGNIWVSNATCTSTTDTTCSFTLSEVLGVGNPTITPLANQAAELQGTEPQIVSKPLTMKSKAVENGSTTKVKLSQD